MSGSYQLSIKLEVCQKVIREESNNAAKKGRSRNPRTRVRQITGFCQLSGMDVTKHDEALMSGIIDGEIDGAEYRKKLVEFYKNSSSRKGKK